MRVFFFFNVLSSSSAIVFRCFFVCGGCIKRHRSAQRMTHAAVAMLIYFNRRGVFMEFRPFS